MLPCMNKWLFGLDCPGCGTQRAFALILKGDFIDAFYMFPAIYTTIFLFASLALNFIDRKRNYHKLIVYGAVVNASIMIIAYIVKIFNL